jgi:hypothetical protein
VVNQAEAAFNQMKKLSRSQVLTLGTSDYEEMERQGNLAYEFASSLVNDLKQKKEA